jgi:hypothetical protein
MKKEQSEKTKGNSYTLHEKNIASISPKRNYLFFADNIFSFYKTKKAEETKRSSWNEE